MSAPFMGALGIGSSIFGSLLGAAGAERGGAAQAGMYNYQAGIAALNAQIARQNAEYVAGQGEISAGKYGLGARQQMGHIVAGQSASGLDVRSGSAREVQESQHLVSMMDMGQIRENAAKAAYDYKVQATQFTTQAALDTMAAGQAKQAGTIGAVSSLVGGAGAVASKWYQQQSIGMFGGGNTSQPLGA